MCRASIARRAPRERPNRAVVIATALFVAWLLFPISSVSAPGSLPGRRVLLVMDRPHDPLLERVDAEIAGLGLDIVRLGTRRGDHASLGPLEAVARRERAVAAIRVLPSRKGVEVWMADETSGRSLLRQVVVDESPSGPNEGLVALQTAELLRTSLFSKPPESAAARAPAASPAEAAPPSSRASSTPSASLAGRPPPPSPEWGLGAGMGALYSPGGADTALQLWLSLHRSLGAHWAVGIDLSAPARDATVSGPEGSARLGSYWAGGAFLGRFGNPSSRGPYAGLGIGAALVHLRAVGHAGAPLLGNPKNTTTGAAYLRADAGFAMLPWLALGVRAVAGRTVETVTIRFAGNDAASWGSPLLAALVVAELRWL